MTENKYHSRTKNMNKGWDWTLRHDTGARSGELAGKTGQRL